MIRLWLDPGHGGVDSGANGYGLREKDLTLKISKRIAEILEGYQGIKVELTRTTDKSLSLKQRTDMINKGKPDYLISVHINATPGGHGFESFIYNGPVRSNTVKFRSIIHDEIVKALGSGTRDRGKKKANFHMLRESKVEAMLTENYFIDTKSDNDKLRDPKVIEKIAQGHANGVIKVFNLKKKPAPKPKPKPSGKTHYWRVVAGSYTDKKNAENQMNKLKKLGIDGVFLVPFEK